ncbi:hypothetical protein AXX17_AT2G41450 [Arabidopsis thaliana]|uniref:Uncharacterized protein n=1 Tax=Arabidopsis thaliana TaxID=3702 RepID=A0A178VU45_ARATH|nr:hypothetical protein AXX17_AT2G41450 [Arabidopsis thaliana]
MSHPSSSIHEMSFSYELLFVKLYCHPFGLVERRVGLLLRYLGTVRESDSLNIMMQFVPGGSISSLLAKFGSFPEPVSSDCT